MKTAAAAGLIVVLAMPAPAQAFLGFGDVSFDPAAHAELVKLYQEALQLYRLTRQEVQRAGEISRFIRTAESDRRIIRGQPLGPLLRDAFRMPVGPGKGSPGNEYRRLVVSARRLDRVRRTALRDLSVLDRLMPGTQHSASLIARSTALLATLAAGREERAARRRAAVLHALRRNEAASARLPSVYRALGARSW